MKIRFLLVLVGLAISFALPSFAQRKTRSIQKSISRLKHCLQKVMKRIMSTTRLLWQPGTPEDAVFVGGGGGPEPHYGRQAIEKRIALDMASFPEQCSSEYQS